MAIKQFKNFLQETGINDSNGKDKNGRVNWAWYANFMVESKVFLSGGTEIKLSTAELINEANNRYNRNANDAGITELALGILTSNDQSDLDYKVDDYVKFLPVTKKIQEKNTVADSTKQRITNVETTGEMDRIKADNKIVKRETKSRTTPELPANERTTNLYTVEAFNVNDSNITYTARQIEENRETMKQHILKNGALTAKIYRNMDDANVTGNSVSKENIDKEALKCYQSKQITETELKTHVNQNNTQQITSVNVKLDLTANIEKKDIFDSSGNFKTGKSTIRAYGEYRDYNKELENVMEKLDTSESLENRKTWVNIELDIDLLKYGYENSNGDNNIYVECRMYEGTGQTIMKLLFDKNEIDKLKNNNSTSITAKGTVQMFLEKRKATIDYSRDVNWYMGGWEHYRGTDGLEHVRWQDPENFHFKVKFENEADILLDRESWRWSCCWN